MRRQAKVAADRKKTTRTRTTTQEEPVAEPSREIGESSSVKKIGDGAAKGESVTVRRAVGSQSGPKGLSRAQINTVKTMIYIVVCFIVCWMPLYCYGTFMRFSVTEQHCNS